MQSTSKSVSLDEALPRITPKPSEESLAALRRLAAHPPDTSWRTIPRKKLAAVLCLLSVDDAGHLQVTLTTRALTLRTSPGETALPGGRFEASDASIEDTAMREANEEIALPLDTPIVQLTALSPFIRYTHILVIPIVCLLAAPASTVLPHLRPNPAEVSAIFTARLDLFLGHSSPDGYTHSHEDLPWIGDALFRLHAFGHPSFASDVTGLTAEILLAVALIAAGEEGKTAFEHRAKGQLEWSEMVEHVLDGRAEGRRRKRAGQQAETNGTQQTVA